MIQDSIEKDHKFFFYIPLQPLAVPKFYSYCSPALALAVSFNIKQTRCFSDVAAALNLYEHYAQNYFQRLRQKSSAFLKLFADK